MEEKKNLEVVSDNGSNLEISPVYDHLNAIKPKPVSKKPTCIVIPKTATKKTKEKEKKKEKTDTKTKGAC